MGALAAAAVIAAAIALAIALSSGQSNKQPPKTTQPSPKPTQPAPGTTAPAQPAPAATAFGANVGRLFNDQAYSPEQIDAQLAALQRTGATVARSDALWEASEPTAPSGGTHHYDWRFDDSIATALAKHNLRWIPIVDYSAPWAQSVPGKDHSPPASVSDYASYAAAIARRYGPGGAFWTDNPSVPQKPVDTYEIWNEPDNPVFWAPTPNAGAYASLYMAARDAIDTVDPAARVLIGGLTHPTTFVQEMVSASAAVRGHIDGVGIHPYGATPNAVLSKVRSARLTLDSLGMRSVPLYVTEVGWTIHPAHALDWAPAQRRPSYIDSTLFHLGHADCGVSAVLVYAWFTPQRNPSNPQDWFGMSSPSATETADTIAFTQGVRAATSPATTVPLCG